jgi:hypothetical protein
LYNEAYSSYFGRFSYNLKKNTCLPLRLEVMALQDLLPDIAGVFSRLFLLHGALARKIFSKV